jgi:hypothetical protein
MTVGQPKWFAMSVHEQLATVDDMDLKALAGRPAA